jgi:hypothetical protein
MRARIRDRGDAMGRKLPWPEIIVTALVIAAGAAVFVYAHRDEDALTESKERGAAIVAALTAYRSDRGTYPERLDQLVPAHMDSLEAPVWGLRRWRYRRYAPADINETADTAAVYFQLSVAADDSGYPVLYYDFAAGRWVLNN